jgi:hypothetical protein
MNPTPAHLGRYGKSSPTPPQGGSEFDEAQATIERYALQAQARRSMLYSFGAIPDVDRPRRAHAVTRCRRWLRPSANDSSKLMRPVIMQHVEGSTFYAGHEICGSARACPVCLAKISALRAAEIQAAVSEWIHSGGICLFVTLTFAHTAEDQLAVLVRQLQDALKRFRKGRVFDLIKTELGYIGLIRVVEITYGDANGFHPHSHEIWFIRPALRDEFIHAAEFYRAQFLKTGRVYREPVGVINDYKFRIYQLWRSAAQRAGLGVPTLQRGLDIRIAESSEQAHERIAEYLAKAGLEVDGNAHIWGVDDELIRANSKTGKPNRFTPFDFLRQQYNPHTLQESKTRYLSLFSEFVSAFKGVAFVFWSRGLKKLFRIAEITDEDAAETREEMASFLSEINPHHWAMVIGFKDRRARLLNLARSGGAPAVREYLHQVTVEFYKNNFTEHIAEDAKYLLTMNSARFESFSFAK